MKHWVRLRPSRMTLVDRLREGKCKVDFGGEIRLNDVTGWVIAESLSDVYRREALHFLWYVELAR